MEMSDEALRHCSGSAYSVHFCRDNKPGAHQSRCRKYRHMLVRGKLLLDLRCEACVKDTRSNNAFAGH